MQDAVHDLPGDDEPVPMTTTERSVWAYLVAVVLTSGAYLTYLGVQLASTPPTTSSGWSPCCGRWVRRWSARSC